MYNNMFFIQRILRAKSDVFKSLLLSNQHDIIIVQKVGSIN